LPAAAAASLARAIGRRLVNFAAFTRRKLSWMGLLAFTELSQVSIESFDTFTSTDRTKDVFMGFGEFLSPLKMVQVKAGRRKIVHILIAKWLKFFIKTEFGHQALSQQRANIKFAVLKYDIFLIS
jgi:hypothetical protein